MMHAFACVRIGTVVASEAGIAVCCDVGHARVELPDAALNVPYIPSMDPYRQVSG